MRNFIYERLHLKSGQVFDGAIDEGGLLWELNRLHISFKDLEEDFYKLINHWNRADVFRWKYWVK